MKDILIPQFKATVWNHILELIMKVQIYEDTGNRLEETFSAIREYLDLSTLYDEDNWKDALTSYRPFKKEGKVWISIQGWQRSVDIHRSINLSTRRKLLNRLAQAGFVNKKFVARVRGSLVNRWYLGTEPERIYEAIPENLEGDE